MSAARLTPRRKSNRAHSVGSGALASFPPLEGILALETRQRMSRPLQVSSNAMARWEAQRGGSRRSKDEPSTHLSVAVDVERQARPVHFRALLRVHAGTVQGRRGGRAKEGRRQLAVDRPDGVAVLPGGKEGTRLIALSASTVTLRVRLSLPRRHRHPLHRIQPACSGDVRVRPLATSCRPAASPRWQARRPSGRPLLGRARPRPSAPASPQRRRLRRPRCLRSTSRRMPSRRCPSSRLPTTSIRRGR
jgi:hypothetical protein